jgi:LPS sulfotransferase NodH
MQDVVSSSKSPMGGVTAAEVAGARPHRADGGAADLWARRFDLPGPVMLRKSYIVASTPRSGGSLLCAKLWQTGVLGAPSEYLGYPSSRFARRMAARLAPSSPADYLAKVLARRTSRNGVFGAKAYFKDFIEGLGKSAEELSLLSPVTYIHMDRRDKLAQAVSMVEALLSEGSAFTQRKGLAAPRYDRDLISKYVGLLERGRLSWTRWFEANSIVPFVVTYEDLIADQTRVVRSIVELLGAQDDEREEVHPLPQFEEQSEASSSAWATRFEREIQRGIYDPRGTHVLDRYNEIAGVGAEPGARLSAAQKRLRHRYEALIASRRDLFKGSRVLDIRSGDGRWCLAALDAGATYVLGLEPRRKRVETAKKALIEDGVRSDSYQFVDDPDIFAALATLHPHAFDVALVTDFSALSDPYLCFRQLKRLQITHVIIDTDIVDAEDAVARFDLKRPDEPTWSVARPSPGLITAVPSEALIRLLSDHFGFRAQPISWHSMGIADWTGVRDYERGGRRTYVLDLIS